jgi:integrase
MLTREILQEVIRYKPAKLHTGKCWYISYYAFNPESGKLDIKRIKLNNIDNAVERRKYANEIMKRINAKLERDWNPFTEREGKKAYMRINEAFDHYLKVLHKKFKGKDIRDETYYGYTSFLENLIKWMTEKKLNNIYVYQFDKGIVNRFLEYIYVERNRTSKTRDNYLTFLRVLSTFLVENEYITIKPTEGISVLGKASRKAKNRNVIKPEDRERLKIHLEKDNPHMLLACEILYYCFIRPKEMSYLKISHINLEKQTIFVPGETAKNYKDAVVTIPMPLKEHFEHINIKNFPGDYYLFSDQLQPGKTRRDEKQFRDYWAKVKKALKFPDTYKFYSLKDTGITNLIAQTGDPTSVRDQARHHSISITDLYTPHESMNSNSLIANNNSKF